MKSTKLPQPPVGIILVVVAALSLVSSRPANATEIIASHQGSKNPTSEGFSLWPYNGGISAGSLVEAGHSGWDIKSLPDPFSELLQALYDSGPLTGSQLTALNSQGWVMSLAGRVISGPMFDSSTSHASAIATLGMGSIRYDIEVGLNNRGDTVVTLATGATINPDQTLSTPGLSYILPGSGSSYHEYDLVYDAGTRRASLYVDGTQRITGYTGYDTGNSNTGNYGLLFGSLNEGNANFTLAQVETGGQAAAPEPPSLTLLAFGSLGLLGFAWRRWR
jgi:hypothetical protein